MLADPLKFMFVTFASLNMAREVHDNFQRSFFNCVQKNNGVVPPVSSEAAAAVVKLQPENWYVTFASPPDDIYFANLAKGRRYYLFKLLVVNIGLFLFTFFLTTPEYIVSQTDWIVSAFGNELQLPSWLLDFLPTLMLWGFTSLLPLVGT